MRTTIVLLLVAVTTMYMTATYAPRQANHLLLVAASIAVASVEVRRTAACVGRFGDDKTQCEWPYAAALDRAHGLLSATRDRVAVYPDSRIPPNERGMWREVLLGESPQIAEGK